MRIGAAAVALVLLAGCSPSPDPSPHDGGTDSGLRDAGPRPRDGGSDAGPCPDATFCMGECVDVGTDPRHCGSCGAACSPPGHATATCEAMTCGFECENGWVLEDDACVEAPRLVFPPSLSAVTNGSPAFRFELPPGIDTGRLEVCPDRACGTLLASLDVTGTTATLSSPLGPGRAYVRIVAGARTSPTWRIEVREIAAPITTAWGIYPDYDGDGFGDLAVGAPAANASAGRIYVYAGEPGGTMSSATAVLAGPDGAGAELAFGLACAGDLDGDGYADLAAGAPGASSGSGRVHLYFGRTGGLPAAPDAVIEAPASATGSFGASVAGAGDVDADGYGDLVVGAPGEGVTPGRAYLFRGNRLGVDADPTWEGTDAGGYASAIAGAGDVNGDGHADIAVSSPAFGSMAGRVHVLAGSATGIEEAPLAILDGPDGAGAQFGLAVASAGDLDADGYADLIVGAPSAATSRGRFHIFSGSATGPSATPDATVEGQTASGGFLGSAVTGIGDGDDDGYDDVAAGAFGVDTRRGRVVVVLGSATGLVTTSRQNIDGIYGPDADFGRAIAFLGDVDGNTRPDVAAGAPRADSDGGRAYIYRAGPGGLLPDPLVQLSGASGGSFGRTMAGGMR